MFWLACVLCYVIMCPLHISCCTIFLQFRSAFFPARPAGRPLYSFKARSMLSMPRAAANKGEPLCCAQIVRYLLHWKPGLHLANFVCWPRSLLPLGRPAGRLVAQSNRTTPQRRLVELPLGRTFSLGLARLMLLINSEPPSLVANNTSKTLLN